MIKSRLRERRQKLTVAVKVKTLASGQYTEATINEMDSLVATREQREAIEVTTDGGAMAVVSDVFWFAAEAGSSLPAIEEKHVLVDTNSVRYEVLSVQDQGGQDERLRVMTTRLR